VSSEIAVRLALVKEFPGLAQSAFEITSQPTRDYNCIAWAAGDSDRFWWPGAFWPAAVGRKVTRANFIRAFEGIGYKVCATPDPEEGYEKVALYEDRGVPTHAARLLPNGSWTSKLGHAHDISHSLEGLNGSQYGAPVIFMRRPVSYT
jgi:hypothetical protein